MYQVLISIIFVSTCFSLPIAGPRSQQQATRVVPIDPDVVDSVGGGYLFFHKQNIDTRPTSSQYIDIPSEDLEEYSESSAFEQPLIPVNRNLQRNTYPSATSNQFYYQPQQQQQQRAYSPQINFGNQQFQPKRNQQRPLFNTASQYPMQSFTSSPRQIVYGSGW